MNTMNNISRWGSFLEFYQYDELTKQLIEV